MTVAMRGATLVGMRAPRCMFMWLTLAMSCGSSTLQPDAQADPPCTGGQVLVYSSPGCGTSAPTPVCAGPAFDACFNAACGCDGEALGGCGQYTKPFAHLGSCEDGGGPF